ncbi:GFA family protein [Lysobacter sp. SG-8]|uniref:GFA family protein n=1 Tax=Marilutibacter penaei TaxID=2759900 RepID=A0A7W3U642_9GAMM|nr:GFA family protein [Lysobacter penaei]MBB1089601.1 GFA family protein [Lysobacter penaei]
MNGTCLCGAIEVTVPDCDEIALCHCAMCRRWSGGPMFAVHGGANVAFSGAEPVRYRSSDWAERGFCGACGTHLFYCLLQNGEYALPAGLFQDRGFTLTTEIFIDEKPGFYAFANDTRKMTGEEAFAEFSPD